MTTNPTTSLNTLNRKPKIGGKVFSALSPVFVCVGGGGRRKPTCTSVTVLEVREEPESTGLVVIHCARILHVNVMLRADYKTW